MISIWQLSLTRLTATETRPSWELLLRCAPNRSVRVPLKGLRVLNPANPDSPWKRQNPTELQPQDPQHRYIWGCSACNACAIQSKPTLKSPVQTEPPHLASPRPHSHDYYEAPVPDTMYSYGLLFSTQIRQPYTPFLWRCIDGGVGAG